MQNPKMNAMVNVTGYIHLPSYTVYVRMYVCM